MPSALRWLSHVWCRGLAEVRPGGVVLDARPGADGGRDILVPRDIVPIYYSDYTVAYAPASLRWEPLEVADGRQ